MKKLSYYSAFKQGHVVGSIFCCFQVVPTPTDQHLRKCLTVYCYWRYVLLSYKSYCYIQSICKLLLFTMVMFVVQIAMSVLLLFLGQTKLSVTLILRMVDLEKCCNIVVFIFRILFGDTNHITISYISGLKEFRRKMFWIFVAPSSIF